MREFREPPQESATACENWDIGPFKKGLKQLTKVFCFINNYITLKCKWNGVYIPEDFQLIYSLDHKQFIALFKALIYVLFKENSSTALRKYAPFEFDTNPGDHLKVRKSNQNLTKTKLAKTIWYA